MTVPVILFDDRLTMTGVKLAMLSLARHSPDLRVVAFLPEASDEFVDWAKRFDNVEIRRSRESLVGRGANTKPTAILALLDEGCEQAIWLDTDIIVCGDLASRLAEIPVETVVGTEDYYWCPRQGDPLLITGLGLEPARVLSATLNSGMLRFSKAHRPVLEHWASILTHPDYLAAMQMPPMKRPFHYFSEQGVLAGLLGSSQYADLDVAQLKRGVDIAQCFGPSGFTLRERIATRGKFPLLVHAMGDKPWNKGQRTGQTSVRGKLVSYYKRVHLDVTPYTAAAAEYRDQMDEGVDWMAPATSFGRVLLRIWGSQPLLREAPLTIIDSGQRQIRRTLNISLDDSGSRVARVRHQPG